MIGKRYIDGDKLVEKLRVEERESPITADFVAKLFGRAPKAPKLIGRQRAAEILGVTSPYISVLAKQGEMPDPIPVEGGKDAYDEAEVKALAKKRKRLAKKEKTQ